MVVTYCTVFDCSRGEELHASPSREEVELPLSLGLSPRLAMPSFVVNTRKQNMKSAAAKLVADLDVDGTDRVRQVL